MLGLIFDTFVACLDDYEVGECVSLLLLTGVALPPTPLSLPHPTVNDVVGNHLQVDRRGDVGSWVREAAMEGLDTVRRAMVLIDDGDIVVSPVVAGADSSSVAWTSSGGGDDGDDGDDGVGGHGVLLWTRARGTVMLARLAGQASEKIDRLRGVAGTIFERVVRSHPSSLVPAVPFRERLLALLDEPVVVADAAEAGDADGAMVAVARNWAIPTHTFPLMAKLMHLEPFLEPVRQSCCGCGCCVVMTLSPFRFTPSF